MVGWSRTGSSFLFHEEKKRNKEKTPAGIFLPTPTLFYTKQKELALLKQLFVFNAPKSAYASRQKKEAGSCLTYIASLGAL